MTYEWDIPSIKNRPIEMKRLIVKQGVCREFGCMLSQMLSPSKKGGRKLFTDAKMVYAYLTRKYFHDSLNRIGMELNLDHTTVCHLLKRMDDHIFIKDLSATKMRLLEKELFLNYAPN